MHAQISPQRAEKKLSRVNVMGCGGMQPNTTTTIAF